SSTLSISRLAADPQYLHKHIAEGVQMQLAKIADGPEVRALCRHNGEKRQVPFAGLGDLPAGKHPHAVGIQHQARERGTKPWCGEVVKPTGFQTYFSWQCFHAQPGGVSWTPRPYSAPMSTAMPEATPAKAILVSMRRRSSASSATRVTQPSVPAKVPSSIGCALRQRPWCSWGACVPTGVPLHTPHS